MEEEQNVNSQSEQAPLGNMLSAQLSNPELMEKIKAIAGQMSTASEQKADAAQDKADALRDAAGQAAEDAAAQASTVTGIPSTGS